MSDFGPSKQGKTVVRGVVTCNTFSRTREAPFGMADFSLGKDLGKER